MNGNFSFDNGQQPDLNQVAKQLEQVIRARTVDATPGDKVSDATLAEQPGAAVESQSSPIPHVESAPATPAPSVADSLTYNHVIESAPANSVQQAPEPTTTVQFLKPSELAQYGLAPEGWAAKDLKGLSGGFYKLQNPGAATSRSGSPVSPRNYPPANERGLTAGVTTQHQRSKLHDAQLEAQAQATKLARQEKKADRKQEKLTKWTEKAQFEMLYLGRPQVGRKHIYGVDIEAVDAANRNVLRRQQHASAAPSAPSALPGNSRGYGK